MAYFDAHGNVVKGKQSAIGYIFSLFAFIVLFFTTLLGIASSRADENDNRDHLRRSGGGDGVGGGAGGPGGLGRDEGMRRPIGRLPRNSGMSGGGCPGGACGR